MGDDVKDIVVQWVDYMKTELLMGHDDPLFPKPKMGQGKDRSFQVIGLSSGHWSNASAIRRIFKDAFTGAGLRPFNPHSFRNTLAALGERLCNNAEEFKAWSQNLGHEGVLTTFYSYGEIEPIRQVEIIQRLDKPRDDILSTINTAKLARELAVAISEQASR